MGLSNFLFGDNNIELMRTKDWDRKEYGATLYNEIKRFIDNYNYHRGH
jgi:hypothetical protein